MNGNATVGGYQVVKSYHSVEITREENAENGRGLTMGNLINIMVADPLLLIFFVLMWILGLPLTVYFFAAIINRPKVAAAEQARFERFKSLKATLDPEQARILQEIFDEMDYYGKSDTDTYISLEKQNYPVGKIVDAMRHYKEFSIQNQRKKF